MVNSYLAIFFLTCHNILFSMKILSGITDPVSVRRPVTGLDHFFVSLLRDERDLPFVYLTLKLTFTLIPLAVLLYVPSVPAWLWWVAAVAYQFLNNVIYKGPYGLMMHCTSHRPFFKSHYGFL